MDIELQHIVSEIRSGNCILIIGPDIIDCGEKSFFQTMCEYLFTDVPNQSLFSPAPQYIFVNEELLQFQSTNKEPKVLTMIETFYRNQKGFDEPFRKISQMPFHLIISLLPDDRLQNIYKEQKLDFSYSYHPKRAVPRPVEIPTQKKPLIYNLLGDLKNRDVIITFDHFFTFLSGILHDRQLPENIQQALNKPQTFLFLGVHFEKWYVQLLLRIISLNNDTNKLTISKSVKEDNIDYTSFIAGRLGLEFLPRDPMEFLDAVYNECRRQNVLKTIPCTATVFISYSHQDKQMVRDIRERFQQANIDVVIDDTNMKIGQKIDAFLNTVKNVDIVMPLISRASLQSPFVAKEIILTSEEQERSKRIDLLPFYIDTLFEERFEERVKETVNEGKNRAKGKIEDINAQINERKYENARDLYVERDLWADYLHHTPTVTTILTERLCGPVLIDSFEANMKAVIHRIQNIMKDREEKQ